MNLGDAGLWLLLRLKLRGTLRKQWRRLRTPSGIVFALLGLLLMVLWIGSLAFGWRPEFRGSIDDGLRIPATQAAYFCLGIVTLASALNHRGLYLPKEEIERLFSAPVTRRDIIRYRLFVNFGRAILGALILGLAARGSAPVPLFGFLGGFLTVATFPVLGQTLSILAGDAENRLFGRLPKKTLRTLAFLAGLAVWAVVFSAFVDGGELSDRLAEFGLEGGVASLFGHPAVRWTTWPFFPWAAMTMAPDAATFLGWGMFCLVFWVALFEGTVRLPVDFRELSLATSADVAKRIRRQRSGGIGASASVASKRTVGWRVPWLFSRGPYGAIAWRKLVSILRKARGTVLTSLGVVVFVTILATAIGGGDVQETLAGGVMIAIFGTIYLSGLLRFDYRDDIDQMHVIKAWPVRPARAFCATLLPQVLLVSAVVALAQLARMVITAGDPGVVIGLIAIQPLLAFTLAALDNLVFLYAPVRYVPGQDGALHHSGRMVVTLLLKGVVLIAVVLIVTGVVFLTTFLAELGGVTEWIPALAAFAGTMVLVVVDIGLVLFGGVMLRRFDVARDRG